MSQCSSITEWAPNKIIKASTGYAMILLNQPILKGNYFVNLWNSASVRVSVDGGGNQWDAVRQNYPNIEYPHIVSGDFDSIGDYVMDLFKKQTGIYIEKTPDQDETDFTKAIRKLKEKMALQQVAQVSTIVAYCENSGRFDQIMANIETLFHVTKIIPNCQLYIMGSTSITWLLSSGSHRILCEDLSIPYCSLIPVGSPSLVATTGLKWNLANDKLAFGHLVSTSNEIDKENVKRICTVETSEPILWSMEIEIQNNY